MVLHKMPDKLEEERLAKNGYWENELRSLGIEPGRKNELNDINELESLTDNIKHTFYRHFKKAYRSNSREIDLSHCDYIIILLIALLLLNLLFCQYMLNLVVGGIFLR
jgi:hypothetical protein